VDDANFIKLVAILRIAVPYTGMILSTRESPAMRDALLAVGMSQVREGGRVGSSAWGLPFVSFGLMHQALPRQAAWQAAGPVRTSHAHVGACRAMAAGRRASRGDPPLTPPRHAPAPR
jgi:hypothetical protein